MIAGKGLSLGYVNNVTLTAEKFIDHNGQRIYRTGDLVYQKANGDYIFIGRVDRQIKVNGQLVAPEEIELKLLEMASVEKAAIVAIEENHKRKLIAFVQTTNIDLKEQEVIAFLKKHLACWMIPHQVIILAELPVTTSHKIDYQNLETQYRLKEKISHDASLSLDSIESKLQIIWKHVLKRQTFCSTEVDFFSDLGGDSLAALEMILLAEKQGLPIPIELLPTHRTIALLASKIKIDFSIQEIPAQSAAWLRASMGDILLGKPKAFLQVINQQNDHDSILLTGATGFLGIYLLKELLKQTTRKIVCLVRAKSEVEAYERIYHAAQKVQVHFDESEQSRIVPILGDIAQSKLGMTHDNWQMLAKSVGEIMHCGAVVHMQKDYADLKATNAECLQEIISFSQTVREKKIHYISTLSVFVSTDKLSGVCYEDDDLKSTKKVYGGYAQSKWAAECYLWALKKQGLPINIFRLGLITGNSQTGVCATSDFLQLFMQGLISLGCYPEGDWSHLEMDVTPVDFAARAIVHIANQAQTNCFHIANASRFSLAQIIEVLSGHPFSLRKITNGAWRHLFSALQASDPKQAIVYMSLCRAMKEKDFFTRYRTMDLFQSTDFIFDRKNTLQSLEQTDIICPQANGQLLKLYLEKMTKCAQVLS